VPPMILGLSAAAVGALGLYWLVQALRTGRVRGRFGRAAVRANQPARFWLMIAIYLGVVANASFIVWTVVTHGRSGNTFQVLHPLGVGREIPESPKAKLSAAGCEGSGPRVCLVIVGVSPDVSAENLARYISALIKRPVGILPPIPLTRQVEGLPLVNERRRQAGAGALERLVSATYPMLWRDRDATMLILTGYDIWLESRPNQRYAFGTVTVRTAGGGFAVVSSARMDPAAYGRAPDPGLLERRVRVMVGKYLAMMLYGARPSADPASPFYNRIQSPGDLDRMQLFSPPAD
jgi:hypothetical protein